MVSLEVLDSRAYFETVPIERTVLEEIKIVKDIKRRYANLIPQKPKTEEKYPLSWIAPVYVSDLIRKKKLTLREQTILIEKVKVAEQYHVHPDCVSCYCYYECY